ncbi:MAG: phosphoribosylformylglycinamidine synthase I [bacterium]
MGKVAVVQFPGSNCDYETLDACLFYGLKASFLRWTASLEECQAYDAFILPGGFSYQDRIRAGVVASKLPLLRGISLAAKQGYPVLGICNGCQILAEAGLVPDIPDLDGLQMALAENRYDQRSIGFICDWVYVRFEQAHKSLFTRYFSDTDVLPVPINHGEGRFVFSSSFKKDTLELLSVMRYVDVKGSDVMPLNGSTYSVAGLSNQRGNIFAMMPHPERAAFHKQVPVSIKGSGYKSRNTQNMQGFGPWEKLFVSLKDALS